MEPADASYPFGIPDLHSALPGDSSLAATFPGENPAGDGQVFPAAVNNCQSNEKRKLKHQAPATLPHRLPPGSLSSFPMKGTDMSVATLKVAPPPPGLAELTPQYFDTERIVTPGDNPVYTPAMLADLEASIREYGQLVPGWVAPSPELAEDQRQCLEGNRRLAVARMLGLPFWAFDLGRVVPEAERIRLTFQHHQCRRVMSREEIAERAARYIELTSCPAREAAKLLNISGPTLSRAFGERRILPELRERADRLGLSIRSLIAAAPAACMARALDFAETPDASGKKRTRDQVAE